MNSLAYSQRAARHAAVLALLLATAVGASTARAQAASAGTPSPSELEDTPRTVGPATKAMFDRQRLSKEASVTPRPVPGEIASRSYKRYLDSFDHPIPAAFKSSVGGKSSQ